MANARETPDERSIAAFTNALSGHNKVVAVTQRDGTFLLDVQLENGTTLAVFMTNLYVVGQADVIEIQADNPGVDCIVTLSAWNMTASDAVEYGREREIGVFKWKEFFGAINYRKYWLYEELPLGIDAAKAAAERKRRWRVWN